MYFILLALINLDWVHSKVPSELTWSVGTLLGGTGPEVIGKNFEDNVSGSDPDLPPTKYMTVNSYLISLHICVMWGTAMATPPFS